MPSIDLTPIPIPNPTTLIQIRTSKLKHLGPVLSGIDKKERQGKQYVSKLGLPDDEHDLTFHGGVDKAVHQYCYDNYAYWQSAYPEKASEGVFVAGGFGENLVAEGLNEENICIGDLVRIGPKRCYATGPPSCVLEVSLPRQPCFKLNQRFGIKNFAPKTHQAAKTGWYYRVRQEGFIEPGMEIKVIQRRYPTWSIARLHHYVHRDKTDLEIVQELIAMDVIGDECRDVFKKRWEAHLESKKPKPLDVWCPFKVVGKSPQTSRIVSLELESEEQMDNAPDVPVNSYAPVRLPNGLKRAYSIVRGKTNRFTLGIARDDNSRGGSTYIHDSLHPGDTVHIGEIKCSMEPSGMASHIICIVGGIGITAFLAMMKRRKTTNQTFELHYAVRSKEEIAFSHLLSELGEEEVHTYSKADGQRMDIDAILRDRIWNSQVFVCGPQRMIDAVIAAGKAASMGEDEIFYETFSADAGGDPFTAEVVAAEEPGKKKNKCLEVEGDKTLLQVMRDAGFDVPSSCEVGSCGTCRINVKKGRVEHRGTGLTEEEKGGEMLACVSRGIGHIVVECPVG